VFLSLKPVLSSTTPVQPLPLPIQICSAHPLFPCPLLQFNLYPYPGKSLPLIQHFFSHNFPSTCTLQSSTKKSLLVCIVGYALSRVHRIQSTVQLVLLSMRKSLPLIQHSFSHNFRSICTLQSSTKKSLLVCIVGYALSRVIHRMQSTATTPFKNLSISNRELKFSKHSLTMCRDLSSHNLGGQCAIPGTVANLAFRRA
jgi:hypothetical protein